MTDQAHQLAAAIVDTIGEATSGTPMSRTLPGFAARLSENLAANLRPILFPKPATGPGSEGLLFERCVQAGCSHAAYQHYDEDQPDSTRCYVSGCLCRRYRSGPHPIDDMPMAPVEDPARPAALALLARLDHLTTEEFANGAERPEREALRAALGYDEADDLPDPVSARPEAPTAESEPSDVYADGFSCGRWGTMIADLKLDELLTGGDDDDDDSASDLERAEWLAEWSAGYLAGARAAQADADAKVWAAVQAVSEGADR